MVLIMNFATVHKAEKEIKMETGMSKRQAKERGKEERKFGTTRDSP
jgi:hypothetical protein